MKKLTTLLAGLILALGISTTTFAAQDGDIGGTSQGSMAMTLSVAQQMKISGFEDITVSSAEYDGSQDFSAPIQNICIYTNADLGAYGLTATTDAGQFEFNNGVSYAVNFSSNQSGALSALAPGVAVQATDGAQTIDCSGAQDTVARIQVTFRENNGEMLAGSSSQTLSFQVNPVT